MPTLVDIPGDLMPVQAQVQRVLEQVEQKIQEVLASDLPPVDRLVRHVERYRGKMVRPTLVALCGLACAGEPEGGDEGAGLGPDHLTIAAVCEMIHLATLVHDDVLDDADTRRRSSTVNALYGNEAAVILGDYLFSTAYRLCSTLDTSEAALLIGLTGMTLCTGELLQLHHRENYSLDEPTYFEIVRRKTASLIAASCRLGASCTLRRRDLGEGPRGQIALRLEQFGYDIGVAFQIQDDLLDLTGDQGLVGKPLGKDAEKGKLTLPLIHHLAEAEPVQRGRTLLILADAGLAPAQRTAALVRAMDATDSLAYAHSVAKSLVHRAQRALGGLADSPSKRLLHLMADSVVARAC